MDICDLKQYIIDNNKTVDILESIGMHKIRVNQSDIRCALPTSDNGTAVSVIKENLKVVIYSDNNFYGDIITLLMRVKDLTYVNANRYLHSLLDLEFGSYVKQEHKRNILDVFLNVKQHSVEQKVLIPLNKEPDFDVLPLLHISWYREGILPVTAHKFGVGFSYDKRRIIMEVKKWDTGEIVSYIGRTVMEDYQLFDIPKYLAMYPYNKSLNLYGLLENYKSIQDSGQVVVFESEKSVLKRDSRMDNTAVALGCHSISEYQAKVLLSLNVDIVIAFDKDVPLIEIYNACEKFYLHRKVYYLYDTEGLLEAKESPADKHNNIYLKMLENKIKYDETKHKEFMEWRN